MGNYLDDQNEQNKGANKVKIIEREVYRDNSDINIDAIADKIAEKLMGSIGKNIEKNVENTVKLDKKKDDFDESKTMENLAKAMVVSRKEESNFENLGDTKINKVSDSVNNTVDLLSGLDD